MSPAPRPLARLVGYVLMVFAAIHLVVSFVLFGGPLRDILGAGVGGGLGWSFEMLSAFWFLMFTLPLFLLGFVVQWSYAQTGRVPAPRVLGWGLSGVAALSVIVAGLGAVAVRPGGRAGARRRAARKGRGGRSVTQERRHMPRLGEAADMI